MIRWMKNPKHRLSSRLPIENRRYGRLQACVTLAGDGPAAEVFNPVQSPAVAAMGGLGWATGLAISLAVISVPIEAAEANYDEALVPEYVLPHLLRMESGRQVVTAEDWEGKRRPELLRLFETHVYGRTPGAPKRMEFRVRSVDPRALEGKATRKEVSIQFSGKETPELQVLIYLPNSRTGPVPAFMGLNFNGNHTIHGDPGITIGRGQAGGAGAEQQQTVSARGSSSGRWPVEMILQRGYALVTACYHDLEPDRAGAWRDGVRALFVPNPGDENYPADGWGAIGAWAWGLSRMMDYLETETDIDVGRVALLGHSRLGKTALWAGAQDDRFTLVISNNSGCGGAALSRRQFGETVQIITRSFPHWFCARFTEYSNRESSLPVDQHQLIALIAPRPVYVASASEDLWADPKGEFLSALGAEPVYRLFGLGGLEVDDMPPVDQPVGDRIGYHVRSGKHDVTRYDWEQYLKFADRHFGD
jgi:hypothetical protein